MAHVRRRIKIIIMTDFDYEVAQKKILARGSKYKRNGSKSKRCKLSTDYMTRNQWENLCGDVSTYKMNGPVDWAKFKTWPVSIQEEYLTNLITKYDASIEAIGGALNINAKTLRAHIKSRSLNLPKPKYMGAKDRKLFIEACKSGEFPNADSGLENKQDSSSNEEQLCIGENININAKVEEKSHRRMRMHNISLTFDGDIDVSGIANSLKSILGSMPRGKVTVTCDLLQ